MKNYIRVLKLLAGNTFKRDKSKKINKGMVVAFAYLGMIFLLGSASLSIFIGSNINYIVSLGLVNELIVGLFSVSSLAIGFLGIFSLIGVVFYSKDNEFFLSLPISSQTIFMAKFTIIYLTFLSFVSVFLVPALIVVGIGANMSAVYYIFMLLGVILMPSIPLVIASILSVPIMFIINLIKNRGALTVVIVVALILLAGFLYVWLIMNLMFSTEYESNSDALVSSQVLSLIVGCAKIMVPYTAFAKLATMTEVYSLSLPMSMLVNVGISFGSVAVSLFISTLIFGCMYKRALKASLETQQIKKHKKGEDKQSKAFSSLMAKELKTVLRTPSFALLSFMGMFLVLLVSIMMGNMVSTMGEIEEIIVGMAPALYAYTIMFGVGMTMTGTTAISREGTNFYIMKNLPIDYATQIKAKLYVATIFAFGAVFVGGVVAGVVLQNILVALMIIIAGSIHAYAYNCFAIKSDLKKPKLDWVSPNQLQQNNFNSIVPAFINIGISIVLIAISIISMIFLYAVTFSINLAIVISFSITSLISLLFAYLFHNSLFNNLNDKFDKVEI